VGARCSGRGSRPASVRLRTACPQLAPRHRFLDRRTLLKASRDRDGRELGAGHRSCSEPRQLASSPLRLRGRYGSERLPALGQTRGGLGKNRWSWMTWTGWMAADGGHWKPCLACGRLCGPLRRPRSDTPTTRLSHFWTRNASNPCRQRPWAASLDSAAVPAATGAWMARFVLGEMGGGGGGVRRPGFPPGSHYK